MGYSCLCLCSWAISFLKIDFLPSCWTLLFLSPPLTMHSIITVMLHVCIGCIPQKPTNQAAFEASFWRHYSNWTAVCGTSLWLRFLILEAAPCLVLLLLYYSWIGNQKISWDVAQWYPEMLHNHRRAKTCSFKLPFKRKSHNLFFLSYIWLVKSAVVAIVEWPIVSPPSQPRNYFFMSPSQTNKSAQWIGGILRPELMRLKTCSPETKKGKYQ